MEIERLRNFVTVAELGNVSVAADKLFLSQPALSRQIQALEEELGVSLFIRAGNQISLTYAGRVLLAEARNLTRSYDQVRLRMHDIKGGSQGALKVAAILGA